MGRVQDKVAIITGGSSSAGIGFAIARALAREGAKVVFTGTNAEALAERNDELTRQGFQAVGMRQDVANEDDWKAVTARTVDTFGQLDILVNNSGISMPAAVDEMSLETWTKVVTVNLTGAFLGCKHAVAAMRNQGGGGSVINVASTGALVGFKLGAAYAASKGGMRQLSKVVAIEGAKEQIRCNTVFPGIILTDIFKPFLAANPQHTETHRQAIPMRRLGEPDDIANCVLFLASDESRYITGAEFVVDGGLTSQ